MALHLQPLLAETRQQCSPFANANKGTGLTADAQFQLTSHALYNEGHQKWLCIRHCQLKLGSLTSPLQMQIKPYCHDSR